MSNTSGPKTKNVMESQAMLLSLGESQITSLNESQSLKIAKYESKKVKQVTSSDDEREKWSNGKLDFFFSGLGYAVGLSNVWRFPYLCYKNGGGAFLVAYYIGVVFASIPMFFLEMLVGQYTSQGGPNTWKLTPVFKGIGYASAVMAYLCNLYYIVLLAWSLYYMYSSFAYELPWASCTNWWNTDACMTPAESLLHKVNKTALAESVHVRSSVEEYWEFNILRATDSFDNIGGIRYELWLCLAISWTVVYLCIFKGIKWTGKITYFTSVFPFVLMAIILVRGLTLEGAWSGIKYLFIPDWERLKNSQVWVDAIAQGLYSYGVGLGAVTTLGSYNKFKKDCYKEMLLLSFISEATCMVAGLVIFSVLGYMANISGVDIGEVVSGGPGLAFIAYPSALTQLPISPLWSVLFFLMLIFVALDGEFVTVEGFVTACTDVMPILRHYRKTFLFFVCFSSFAFGTVFVTEGGVYWFEIFDNYSCAGWAMLMVNFFECVAIAYVYGVDKFYENTKQMLGYYPGRFWKYCWLIVTPALCLAVCVFNVASIQPFKYKDYKFPWYGEMIGWMLAFSSILCIPIYAIYKCLANRGNLREIFRPTEEESEEMSDNSVVV